MGLCLDSNCQNKLENGEDYCNFHLKLELDRETDDEEIYKINLNKYYKEIVDKHFEFDFKKIFKNINYKTYTYEDYISDIVNIENNIVKVKNERRNKKYIKKFNDKYNNLIKLNEETIEWANEALKTDYYKNSIIRIINENMDWLNSKIEKNGKDIEFIRKTYRFLFQELCDEWETLNPVDDDDKHDDKICCKTETWKMYAIHENDDWKKMLKI